MAEPDSINAALRTMQRYVRLPYEGRRLVEDAGSPERVRADARNRQMMAEILTAAVEVLFPDGLAEDPHVCTCSRPDVVDAIEVWCPTCGAERGHACRTSPSREVMAEPHEERAKAAADQLMRGCSVGFEDRCQFEAALGKLAAVA